MKVLTGAGADGFVPATELVVVLRVECGSNTELVTEYRIGWLERATQLLFKPIVSQVLNTRTYHYYKISIIIYTL